MKIVMVILSGFVLTLTTYAAGIVTAIFFLDAEPVPVRSPAVDTAEVWTNEPMVVDTAAQEYERLEARPAREIPPPAAQPKAEDPQIIARVEPLVDVTTTGAIQPEATSGSEPTGAPSMNTAHVEWCSAWYRSYRPGDNSYTSYSGEKRECISPYSKGEEAGSHIEASVDRPFVGYAMEDEEPSGYLTSEHVQSCFNRYRSYRPEDNTYQPYGGGPRRQCR